MDEVTFRPAVAEDGPAIAEYHRWCWLEVFAPLLEGQPVEAAITPGRMRATGEERLAPSSGLRTVVAELDGRVVGHTAVRDHEVVNVFVHPDAWRSGVGRRLLAIGEDLVAGGGHDEAELTTLVGNEAALALYRSSGWAVPGELRRSDRTDGLVLTEHVLTKAVGGPPPAPQR